VPPAVIEEAANNLVEGVSEAAGLLSELGGKHAGTLQKISQQLRQEDDEQTRRMATTILSNAFVFQEGLAGGPGDLSNVRSLEEMRGPDGTISKSAVLDEWRRILKVNYWPIFDISRRILETIPTTESKALIGVLAKTAERLLEKQLMHSHDLTGAVFQRLIADRKFLAAYYTTPASAALLVGLAFPATRARLFHWSTLAPARLAAPSGHSCTSPPLWFGPPRLSWRGFAGSGGKCVASANLSALAPKSSIRVE
jgi:hypothetical protein